MSVHTSYQCEQDRPGAPRARSVGRPSAPRRLPQGLTLFELLLVLGLLTILAAISWPAVESTFETARLKTAADAVRTAWSEARLEAMRSGTIHEFRFESDGSRYQLRAWTAGQPAPIVESTPTAESAESEEAFLTGAFTEAQLGENDLPEGVTFAQGMPLVDQRARLTAAAAGMNADLEGVYSPPILFYPDGTTGDAVVYLKNEKDVFVRVTLRGLTGIARVSELLAPDELE